MKTASRALSLLLSVSLLLCAPAFACDGGSGVRYADIPATAPYADAVALLTDKGVFGVHGESEFEPRDPMTRAAFATALWRLAGCPEPRGDEEIFTDLPEGCWYMDAAQWVGENGYMLSSSAGGRFNGDAVIRRQEAAVVLWRKEGYPLSDFDYRVFYDGAKIEKWALPAVSWACEHGLLNQYSDDNLMLKPLVDLNRAEAAQMLCRYAALKNK